MNRISTIQAREWKRANRGRTSSGPGGGRGFGTFELLATVAIVGVLIGLAAPSYIYAVQKRGMTSGAEQVLTFVNQVRSESIKRNRRVTVAYAAPAADEWCIGASTGDAGCNCMETNPESPDFCAIDSLPWVLRDSDIPIGNRVNVAEGDGAYVLDPVRGVLTDPTDRMVLEIDSRDSPFRVNLSIIPTGNVSICLAGPSENIPGFKPCPQESLKGTCRRNL